MTKWLLQRQRIEEVFRKGSICALMDTLIVDLLGSICALMDTLIVDLLTTTVQCTTRIHSYFLKFLVPDPDSYVFGPPGSASESVSHKDPLGQGIENLWQETGFIDQVQQMSQGKTGDLYRVEKDLSGLTRIQEMSGRKYKWTLRVKAQRFTMENRVLHIRL